MASKPPDCFDNPINPRINRDSGLEDLVFQSFSERLHGDVFIRQPANSQNPSLGKGLFEGRPLNIEGNRVLPRRSIGQQASSGQKPINIIDELEKITEPVVLKKHDVEAGNSGSGNGMKGQTYAEKLATVKPVQKINFRFLENNKAVEDVDADVMIPIASVKQVQDRFTNVLFGYFLGKRLAFPVVEYFVSQRWGKYGMQKCMMNGKGFFFFKFKSKDGMEQVLQDGPWLIRNIPLFLKQWSPNTELKKEELKKVPVWVKMHDVPLAAYTEDGLSLIASKVGTPKMLDNETTKMCLDSWGRSGYARAIVELDADKDLIENVTVAIPNVEEGGYLKSSIQLEYEWKPPQCKTCKVFGHGMHECPLQPADDKGPNTKDKVDDQGFKSGNNRKKNKNQQFSVKEKQRLIYRPKHMNSTSSGVPKDTNASKPSSSGGTIGSKGPGIRTSNTFEALNNMDDEYGSEMDEVQAHLLKRLLMDSIAAWNVRGLNHPLKQKEVQKFVKGNNLQVIAILESHVQVEKLDGVCKKVFRNWDWTSNGRLCNKGTRIILGWNVDNVDVLVVHATNQVMHVQVYFKSDKTMINVSFVYASNSDQERKQLWDSMRMHKRVVQSSPWIIMGDFNVALNLDDKCMGSSDVNAAMREFNECVNYVEVFDIRAHGMHYTWNQRPKKGIGIRKKLDRIMANVSFVDKFVDAYAMFLPNGISDHCPGLLKIQMAKQTKPKPFKFTNLLTHKRDFLDVVTSGWNMEVSGVPMFRVVKKLKGLKHPFRVLLRKQGNLHKKVADLKSELDDLQGKLDADPFNMHLKEAESVCVMKYKEATIDEERFLKQKAKQKWLEAGDSNTAYFHNVVKCRNHINKINFIKDTAGNSYDGDEVATALVNHFRDFLGKEGGMATRVNQDCFSVSLNPIVAESMCRPIVPEEVKAAIFSINENKAPGPDGFTSEFFRKSWSIVGGDVTAAIIDFFQSGRLLQEINHTFLALIPKVSTPGIVTDYRPISCCNVIYKGISKIITNRILEGLKDLISDNQSAFVPGRRISDNIMLTQELMHNYHRQRGPPRCAMKVDIQKAYDTVDWRFLRDVLHGFGFRPRFISWIMECITTTSFSVSVNGNVYGYFKGKRGLRQGDPMSPYLFTMVMEVLTMILNKNAQLDPSFRFHNKCEKQMIINMCFADDLILFARGDVGSVKLIMRSLKQFEECSGLVPSNAKSTIFFCNVPDSTKTRIAEVVPFEEGKLPIKYLGVPLIASRLLRNDCKVLVERVDKRINDWKNRFLSFAGKLQLVVAVLSSIHVYWASVFILPVSIIKQLENKMREFLWGNGSGSKGRAKVAWKEVCLPKMEGGLGIRRISDVNKSLMAYHIYSIISGRKSLWTTWIELYRLRGRSIWDIPVQVNSPWGWKRLMKCKDIFREHLWTKIGNGHRTSLWFDKWTSECPLQYIVTPRQMARYGFNIKSKVVDAISDGQWLWPEAWRNVYPILFQLQPLNLADTKDRVLWMNSDNKLVPFSSREVWDSIRWRDQQTSWAKVVWSVFNIPKHAFLCWLIHRKKLWTQDRILRWNHTVTGSMNLMCCLLCYSGVENHEHLFFECPYSKIVWSKVRKKIRMDTVRETWDDITSKLVAAAKSRSVYAVASRLVVAASAYTIWRERNSKLFKNKLRPPEQLADDIIDTVRLKLTSFKYKQNVNVKRFLEEWMMDKEEFLDEE
ncbi:uncharacterized protein LOC110914495 [Helianthus annuus]|uniref:uncharacterized protein LOC110914495 n=1 Tax=Helianthus annuus TaxID=4232 RepID=UPI000B8FB029|nr:uncharacterized protein LOC110914495 [Helianthus annuus]